MVGYNCTVEKRHINRSEVRRREDEKIRIHIYDRGEDGMRCCVDSHGLRIVYKRGLLGLDFSLTKNPLFDTVLISRGLIGLDFRSTKNAIIGGAEIPL